MLIVLTTAQIELLDCPDFWHTEQKHRPLLDKTYHNPSRWAGGGFQGHQASYSHHPETRRDLRERHCEVLVWDLVWHPWEEWWLVSKRTEAFVTIWWYMWKQTLLLQIEGTRQRCSILGKSWFCACCHLSWNCLWKKKRLISKSQSMKPN